MPAQSSDEAKRQDDRAYQLMQSADSLITKGQWAEAARALEQAAELHEQAGRTYDRARCLQLAATLHRSAGHQDLARALIAKVEVSAVHDQPLAVAILTEQGETALAGRRYDEAVAAYTDALREAHQAGLKAEGLSALIRKRAAASIATGAIQRANADLDEAFQRLDAECGRAVAAFVRTEQAGLLWQAGAITEMAKVIAALETDIRGMQVEPYLAAELGVMNSRLARATNQPQEAARYAMSARSAALQAVAPVSYFAASVELAESLQAQDDHTGAYGALATAWATLSDLLGDETASSWVEPVLLGYVARWGEPTFHRAKSEYENQRRNKMGDKR